MNTRPTPDPAAPLVIGLDVYYQSREQSINGMTEKQAGLISRLINLISAMNHTEECTLLMLFQV